MRRVLVIQAMKHQADVSPARAYGEIVFVLRATDRTSADPEPVLMKLKEALKDYDAEKDSILWSGGDPLSLLLVGSVLRDMEIFTFTYLRYEKPDARNPSSAPYYVPITVSLR